MAGRRRRSRRRANDAELVLQRLRTGGAEALTATCGPYAFAILDAERDVLWFGRDPEGEKPLFVVTQGDRVVAFASSVAALRALGLDVRLDRDNIARLLRYGFALSPALSREGYELHANMRGAYVAEPGRGLRAVASPQRAPEAAGDDSLERRVVAAVDRCATAEVPVGLSLSGGVDSSCMAAALHRLGMHVPAYQFRADGAPGEERDRARQVAAATVQDLRTVDAGPEILRALPELTAHTAEPQGDPSVLAAHALARAARRDGVRVLLSGEGADDLWLGYRRHRAATWLPARGLPLPAPRMNHGAAGRMLRALAAPVPYDSLLEVSPPGFRSAVMPSDTPASAGALPATATATALERARVVDRAFYLRHDLLPKCDTALMAAGVEGRCPFLDPAVTARADAVRPRPGKRELKRAFAPHLPPGILELPKLGFGLPLDRWLREDDFIADILTDARTRSREHLRREGVDDMLDRHRAGRVELGHPLYLIAAVELYLRVLEGQS